MQINCAMTKSGDYFNVINHGKPCPNLITIVYLMEAMILVNNGITYYSVG